MSEDLKQETISYWNKNFTGFENIPNYEWEVKGFGPVVLWAFNTIKNAGFLNSASSELSVADFGCGPGFKTAVAYKILSNSLNINLTGIDASDKAIKVANAINNNPKLNFEARWIDEQLINTYDMIFCSGFAYAIGGDSVSPEHLLTITDRNLKKGGFFVLVYNTDLSGKMSKSNWFNAGWASFKMLEGFFKEKNYYTHLAIPQQHLKYYDFYRGAKDKLKYFLLNSLNKMRKKTVTVLFIVRKPL